MSADNIDQKASIMTKKPTPVSGTTNEDEACRRLMISLYGSEAEARLVAEALLRDITPEEEELIERRYNAGDQIADQIVREAGLESKVPAAMGYDVDIPFTEEQEKEFVSFVEAVYRRAEDQQDRTAPLERVPAGVLGALAELGHVAAAKVVSVADVVGEWLSLPLQAFNTIDLAYGKPALATAEVASEQVLHKVGKRVFLADLGAESSQLAESKWRSAEIRLILSINSRREIDDVSITARGSELDKLTNEILDVRLRDRAGNKRTIALSRERLQGYMRGKSLSGDLAELELLVHVDHRPT